jgi:hypothetical protein
VAAAVLTVGGSARSLKAGSLSVMENINGRSSLRASIVSTTGAYIPDIDDAVVLTDSGATVLFGGFVSERQYSWLLQGSGVESTITASDYSALADRRLVSGSTAGGVTIRDVADYVVSTYLASFGVTRDAGMLTGGTVGALSYDYVPCTDVFNDLAKLATGWMWRIDENKVLKAFKPSTGAYPCPFSMTTASSKIAGGDITVTRSRQNYANRIIITYNDGTSVPATATANDAAEQALYGIYDAVIRAEGPLDAATALDVAEAYLAQTVAAPRTIMFTTTTAGARAGQTLTVNITGRVAGAFLITDVETTDFGGVTLLHRVTAVEGDLAGPNWRDTFQTWAGTGSSQVSSGITIVTSQVGRATYFLGGSGIAGEQSSGPAVINAVGYIDVMVDRAAIGASTSVTAVVQCKTASAGVTVTPQVYNVTTATVAGTGSVVTGTAWTTVTFPITVASGQNTYRLRMTPGTANIDCFSLGYLEVGR